MALAGGSVTFAQEMSAQNATGSSTKVNELVVTGRTLAAGQLSTTSNVGLLGDRDIFNTPFSSTSYNEKLIEDQQARNIEDVLDNNSSVRIEGSQFAENADSNIRGFAVNYDSFLFDGVSGLVNSRRAPIEGLSRVDVLLGPSSLLFNGASDDAVGGTINLVPKRAGETALTQFTGSYAMNSDFELQADVGRRFGPDDAFGVRINVVGRAGDTPIDHMREDYGLVTLGLDYRSERLKASLDVVHEDYTEVGAESGFYPSPGFAIPKAPDATHDVWDNSTVFGENNTFELAKVEYAFSPQITASAAVGHRYGYERYYGPNFGLLLDAGGDALLFVLPYKEEDPTTTAQISLKGVFDTGSIHHAVTLTADGSWANNLTYVNVANYLPTNIYDPVPLAAAAGKVLPPSDPPEYMRNYRPSLALADAVTLLGGRLTLIGGLREQAIDMTTYDNASEGTTYGKSDESALTPAGAIEFKLTPKLSVYANYIQGLQSGPTAPIGTTNVGHVFAPFVAEQEEVGAKFDAGSAGYTLAFFQITQPNAYTNDADLFVVSGQIRNRGVELNAFGEVVHGVRLQAGLTYYDPEQTQTLDGATNGKQAVGIPNVELNVGGEWDIPDIRGLTLTGRVIFTSKEYVDAGNTQSIPNWTRVDLGARYSCRLQGRPVTFRFVVQNVAGLNYWQDVTDGFIEEGAPRTLRLSVTTDF